MTGAHPPFRAAAPEELNAEQRELYDRIAGGPRSTGPQVFPLTDDRGALNGPFGLMLLQPRLGAALQEVGAAVRYGGDLTAREREIAILAVASATGSQFERWAHERVGLAMGMDAAELVAIEQDTFIAADQREQLCNDIPRLLLMDGYLDDALYARALAELGQGDLYELVVLSGYYATLAWTMSVFRVGIPDRP